MNLLFRYRVALLALVLGLTVYFGYSLKDFKVDFSFDAFRPKDEPEYEFFEAYRDSFPHYENTVMVALKAPSGNFWELDFLREVDTLFTSFKEIANLDTVISPTRLEVYQRSGMGVKRRPLMNLDEASSLVKAQAKVEEDSVMYGNYFTSDKSYVGGIIMVNPDILDLPERDSVSWGLRKRLEASGMEYVVSGVPFIRTQYVETIRGEITFFLGISVLLAILMMFWLFRSWWGVFLPQIGVGLGMVWTFGFMTATGQPLDLVGELLPTVLFVVGIGDIVHLLTKYQQDLQRGLSAKVAMELTVREIGAAIFLTSLTTAIGFASLYSSPLPPVKAFGLYAAAGVMFAYIVSIVLIPNILLKINPESIRNSKGAGNNPIWERMLRWADEWIKGKGVLITSIVMIFVLGSIWGATQISYDNYLLDDISEKDPVRVNMRFFEEHFYGARPFEMAIIAKKGKDVSDLDILQDVEKIQDFLHTQARISPFMSLTNYLKGANKLYRGGRSRFFKLPSTDDKVEELLGFGYSSGAENYLEMIMSPNRKMARVSGRMPDLGSEKFEVIRENLNAFIGAECQTENFDFRLTGTAVINEANVIFLRQGLFSSLTLAIGLIALLMGVLFKDWKMALIGMIPNILPLLFTAGMMGLMGITLRSSTSIVFLVAFGIAVDDTIHFLSRYRLEIKDGNDMETSLLNTMLGTGKAMILTTMILLSGFAFLMTSSFGGTYVVGLFTALTLVMALLADLFFLPVLIRFFNLGLKTSKAKHSEEKRSAKDNS